jgi:hypothetical protein
MKAKTSLSFQTPSVARICASSVMLGLAVFFVAIFLQWLVYDDWMHRNGPLRLVGSALASALTFAFVYRWKLRTRKQKIEVLQRFERIKWMNDRIRNSLQAIECIAFYSNPHMTDPVRDAVDQIEDILQEVIAQAHPDSSAQGNESSPLEDTVKGPWWAAGGE